MIELKLKRGLTWASLFCANLCTGTCTCMAVKIEKQIKNT